MVLGLLGELHPEVLVRWDVHFPAAGFELRLFLEILAVDFVELVDKVELAPLLGGEPIGGAVQGLGHEHALALLQSLSARVNEAASALEVQPEEITQRILQVQDQVKALEKELAAMKSKLASGQGDELLAQAVDVHGVKVLAASIAGADVTTLREVMDKMKDKLKTAAIVLAAVNDGKVSLIAGVTADTTSKVKAGELVNFVAQQVGGKGGGRPDMAQAGGADIGQAEAAIKAAEAAIGG